MTRLFLSPPDVGDEERSLLLDAFDSNWIAPLGPHVDAFEQEFAAAMGVKHAVALASGTAALHLSLLVHAVGPGDDVLVPTLTFVATANAVVYVGARPVLVDSDWGSWNIDPDLVADELSRRAARGRLPKALIAVDLYGQCADYGRLQHVCDAFEVVLIEDAAEAIGATYGCRPAGSLGSVGAVSFNGNKILTTGGGGMLLTDNAVLATRARHLASQARRPLVCYEHDDIGFNYRMSNLLAAVGRGQLRGLGEKVELRRAIFERYQKRLSDLDGFDFMPEAAYGRSSRWLTVALVDPSRFGTARDDVIVALEAVDVEARPAWKPMHQQPVYQSADIVGGAVADRISERGVCLPSGSAMSGDDIERVAAAIERVASER